MARGSMNAVAPLELVPAAGLVRDGDLGTIGGGNHFSSGGNVANIMLPWVDNSTSPTATTATKFTDAMAW